MAGNKMIRSSGLAALAVALAATALPAAGSAQEMGRHGGWGRDGASEARDTGEHDGRGRGGGEGGGWQGRAQANATVQAAPAAAPAPRQQWNGGGQSGGGWQGRAQSAPPAPPPAQAQAAQMPAPQARSWNGGSRGGGNWQANGNGGWQNRSTPTPQAQPVPQGRPNWQGNANSGGNWRDNNRDHRVESRGNDGWRGNDNGWNNNGRGYTDNRNWNRDWRRDNRYDWRDYRNSNRDLFRLGRYYPPYRGWSYRRLSIGFTLDNLFFGADYWIDDPWSYRLPQAYGPYRWVRYYDDALLVNVYNGEVVDVIYDVFW